MNPHHSKILIALIAIPVLLFGYMFYQNHQSQQAETDREMQNLKKQLSEQQQELSQQQKELAQTQSDLQAKVKDEEQKRMAEELKLKQQLLDKQEEINQLKEQKLDQQLEQMQEVVTDIKQQQDKEQEIFAAQEMLRDKALKTAHIVSGLQMATAMKTQVAEYYLVEGRFPSKNKDLGLPQPQSYATDSVQSLWISKGGRITIVYKQNSGQDKGAINLTPQLKNNSIHWSCETQDYRFIHEMMPQCRYTGS